MGYRKPVLVTDSVFKRHTIRKYLLLGSTYYEATSPAIVYPDSTKIKLCKQFFSFLNITNSFISII